MAQRDQIQQTLTVWGDHSGDHPQLDYGRPQAHFGGGGGEGGKRDGVGIHMPCANHYH